MTGRITILNVQEQDLPVILRLFADSIRQIASRDYSSHQLEVWIRAGSDKSKWLHRINNQYFIAAVTGNNEIAGFASLEKPNHIDLMYVNPPFQGKGIASLLLTTLLIKTQSTHQSVVTVDASITARHFFEKKGFEVLHPNHHVIDGVPLINYSMIYKI